MYVAKVPNRNSPPAYLLRESYREGEKVKTRTLCNISDWAPERRDALRRLLKGELDAPVSKEGPTAGPTFGVLFALEQLAKQCGVAGALGKSSVGRLALFLVLARIAHPGSRLSAVRWAEQHAVDDILGIESLHEQALYHSLDWLADSQPAIEKKLYQDYVKRTGKTPSLMLYDVTSSYLEGEQNALGAYGYNRDGKRGKQQIVIGLLTADDGEPLAVRVFEGNTSDPKTIPSQIELLRDTFSVDEIILVGDRGMIKQSGKVALNAVNWCYITALTTPQIGKLLKEDVIQLDLFDSTVLHEVSHDNKRYVLRCNDALRRKSMHRRDDKLACLEKKVNERNAFVESSKRACAKRGLATLETWMMKHKLDGWVSLQLEDNTIVIHIDEVAREQASALDGCYVLETDVPSAVMDTACVNQRYKDLQTVERNFRTMKTGFLEIRPIFVRKASRTKGHVFVAMLALKVLRHFEMALTQTFGNTSDHPKTLTVDDALQALARLNFLHYQAKEHTYTQLPAPDETQAAIFKALNIIFPKQKTQASIKT